MSRGVFLPGILAVALAAAGPAQAERFAIDPVHTRVAFQVRHAGFSSPVATFSKVTGVLDFDKEDWSKARVEVRSNDEVGQLARTFTVMIDVLRQREREREGRRAAIGFKQDESDPSQTRDGE